MSLAVFSGRCAVSLLGTLVSPPWVLKCLPRMLVSSLMVPFFVVRRGSAVSMRGKIVAFSSLLVRFFHVKSSTQHQLQRE